MGCETKEDIKELARLKKKLSKDKNNVELLFKIGMLLFDTFIDMDQARPYFEKAIKLDFKNPDLLFWFGYALYHGKCFYDEAKELFEQALSLDQSRAEFYYMMFNVLWKITGVAKSGFNYLQNTIKLQPNWLEPREQYITCLVMQNEFEEAEKELSKAYTALEMYHKNKKGLFHFKKSIHFFVI